MHLIILTAESDSCVCFNQNNFNALWCLTLIHNTLSLLCLLFVTFICLSSLQSLMLRKIQSNDNRETTTGIVVQSNEIVVITMLPYTALY